jgi:FixJ family two-component response regulator
VTDAVWECRVAVVDDDEVVCRSIRRLLRTLGFEAEAYRSGTDFLAAVTTFAPDCVVLDLHMPDVDGFETQSRLAKSGRRIPVVVITAHDSPECRSRAIAGGARGYLHKPIEGQRLIHAIRAVIAGRTDLED